MSALNTLFLLTHLSAFTLKCSIYDTPCLASLTQNYARSVIPGGTGFGFEPLDPMSIAPIKGDQDGLVYNLSEIEVLGAKNILIEKVQFNKKENRQYIKYRFPCLTMYANYSMNGNVQKTIPLNGEGKLIFNSYDLEIDMTINYDMVKGKNGKDYIIYNNYLYWFDVRYAQSYFENANKDAPEKVPAFEEYKNREFKRMWQQYGRTLLDKFNDKLFETARKILILQPIENFLSDY